MIKPYKNGTEIVGLKIIGVAGFIFAPKGRWTRKVTIHYGQCLNCGDISKYRQDTIRKREEVGGKHCKKCATERSCRSRRAPQRKAKTHGHDVALSIFKDWPVMGTIGVMENEN